MIASRWKVALALCGGLVLIAPPACPAGEPQAAELREIRRQVEAALADEVRLWFPATVARRPGGFHQNLARDGAVLPDDGYALVYQARVTWTAATLAEFDPARREEFLDLARGGIEHLDVMLRDHEQGGFHWALDTKGQIDPKLGDEKHVYGIAFAIYAAARVREVGGDDRALALARAGFDWLDQHAHDPAHGGYFEALRRDGTPIVEPGPGAPTRSGVDRLGVPYGLKTMNSHIHLLEAVAALARVDDRPIVRERLAELLAIVRDRITAECGALHLYLTPDWRPLPAHDSFGHDVETAFLLVEAAEALGQPEDARTWQVARRLIDHALAWGWDSEHGGFADKGDSVAGSPYDFTKIWWTQAEGLNALLLMHERFGREDRRYLEAFRKQWDFIQRHQLDPEHGGWFGEVSREGRLLGDGRKAHAWKANYHTGRSLMRVATVLRRLEATPAP